MDSDIQKQEKQSIYILRKARSEFQNVGILKTNTKESDLLFALCEKAFFNKMPFSVIGMDSLKNHQFSALIMPFREELKDKANVQKVYPLLGWKDSDVEEYLESGPGKTGKTEKEEIMKRLRDLGYM